MIFNQFNSIWKYRGFILSNVKREFQSKYRNSLLGAVWNVLNPLAMILVYTVIFSEVMRARLPGSGNAFSYSIYLCAGSLTWGLFAEIVGRGQNVFIDSANLIKKISFPRICLPITIILNAWLNFFIIFSIFCVFLLISGTFPGWIFFELIPVIIVLILFAIGLGMTLGVLNVFFRDVGQFFGIFMQFWFWFTPIVYNKSILPAFIKPYLNINPMAPLIDACQQILVFQRTPNWMVIVYPFVLSMLLCFIGMRLFKKHVGEMVDEL